jgi:hypothetical protein
MGNTKDFDVMIEGVKYFRADSVAAMATPLDGKPFVIIRSHGAGVFAGYLARRNDATRVVTLDRCIRLWQWTGCSLSQVANDGIAGTGDNKFSLPTDKHEVFEVLEIIPCTEKARIAIQGVTVWKK